MANLYISYGISPGSPSKDNTFSTSLQEWLNQGIPQCQRKVTNRPFPVSQIDVCIMKST